MELLPLDALDVGEDGAVGTAAFLDVFDCVSAFLSSLGTVRGHWCMCVEDLIHVVLMTMYILGLVPHGRCLPL